MPWVNGGRTRTNTPEHRAWRTAVLTRDQWQCQLRYPDRCIGHATEADHIKPVSLGGPEFDPANGRAACAPCHRLLSSQQGHQARAAKGLTRRPPAPHPGLRT
jgi:5-methylcytosine-specific restriction protein A